MTTCLGKSCLFGYCACLSWAFINLCVCSFPYRFRGMDVGLVSNDCLTFYFEKKKTLIKLHIILLVRYSTMWQSVEWLTV